MSTATDEARLALAQYGIGQPVRRMEDPALLQGQGHYTDDISVPGQLYAAVVRSTSAHGIIRGIETDEARRMPGVHAVYTAADLEEYGKLKCYLPLKNRDGSPIRYVPRPALAADRVRFVGDPVAIVVAETVLQAKDAAERVVLDIEALPAVTLASEAAADGAPQLYDEVPNNVAYDYHYGDTDKVNAAFASAAHVTRMTLRNTRLVANPMEPRAAIGEYDPASQRFTLTVCSQGVFGLKTQLADVLRSDRDKVRVVTGQVGGSFGMKIGVYPEYVCLLHAARALGRPVKWLDERSGSFLSDHHGRDHEMQGELALDKDGHFLAVRFSGYGNLGGYLSTVGLMPPTVNVVKNAASVYRTPLMEASVKCVFTNTPFVSAYRGAGRPEGNYFMERLIDTAAAEIGIDRLELRRRNHIRPREMPYKACSGMTYDSGDFPAVFKEALQVADVAGFARRRRESKKKGRLRGLGVTCYLEVTAPPSPEMGGLRFEADGTVTMITGTLDYGQGHGTSFAQVVSQRLGIPFERLRLLQGDSDELLAGGGTGGSRSITSSSVALLEAADKVIERGKVIAAHVLEASAADIEFDAGRFVIVGTDRSVGIMEISQRLHAGLTIPEGDIDTLDAEIVTDKIPSSFPNGCHVAEVEIDLETCRADLVRYSSVNDFGTLVNPMIVEGQIHGGVVQGLGQAFLENAVFDRDGQFVSGSFMDYAMPRAHDAPQIGFVSHPVPTAGNPVGTKGCGEAGCAGGLPSIMNALVDALSPYGIREFDMPATPERIWSAIRTSAANKTAAVP